MPLKDSKVPHPFRFMVVCEGDLPEPDPDINLLRVVNDLQVRRGQAIELSVVVSAVPMASSGAQQLALMGYRLDRDKGRTPISGWAGTHIDLPEGGRPFVVPWLVTIQPEQSGIHGFELFDVDGVFGTKEAVLASYLFSVQVTDDSLS